MAGKCLAMGVLLILASGIAFAQGCDGYGAIQYGAGYSARAVSGYMLDSISESSNGRVATLNVGGDLFQVGPSGNFTYYTPHGDYMVFDICEVRETSVLYKLFDSREEMCNNYPAISKFSEPVAIGGYSLGLSHVDVMANRSVYGFPAMLYLERNGSIVAEFAVAPGTVHSLSERGSKIDIFVCATGFASSLSSHHAYLEMNVSAVQDPAVGERQNDALPDPKEPLCSTIPKLDLSSATLVSPSGRILEINATVTATHSASCGAQIYGVDFTNAYSADRHFSLWLEGINGRNLFILQPGQSRTFTSKIGITPGLAINNYTVQMTAYSEADHWKQVSKNLQVQVLAPEASDYYWSTPLEIGWNLVPYAQGIGVFGCHGITYAYGHSPTVGDYVKLERHGAEFTGSKGAPSAAPLSGLFVFSKTRCTFQSLVQSSKLDVSLLDIGAGAVVSVLPEWAGKNASDVAAAICPQGGSISEWNARQQRWEGAGILGHGTAVRVLAAVNSKCITRG